MERIQQIKTDFFAPLAFFAGNIIHPLCVLSVFVGEIHRGGQKSVEFP